MPRLDGDVFLFGTAMAAIPWSTIEVGSVRGGPRPTTGMLSELY
jgi:hypothetical protein